VKTQSTPSETTDPSTTAHTASASEIHAAMTETLNTFTTALSAGAECMPGQCVQDEVANLVAAVRTMVVYLDGLDDPNAAPLYVGSLPADAAQLVGDTRAAAAEVIQVADVWEPQCTFIPVSGPPPECADLEGQLLGKAAALGALVDRWPSLG
jgi:hypothetical protein